MDATENMIFCVKKREPVEVKLRSTTMMPIEKDGKQDWDRSYGYSLKLPAHFDETNLSEKEILARLEGLYRIVREGDKWFIELLEEVSRSAG
jgi:hypothetical protein